MRARPLLIAIFLSASSAFASEIREFDPVSAPQLRSLNLSGFASLRETSAIKGRQKFFTLRREGAKKTHDSKMYRHDLSVAPYLN